MREPPTRVRFIGHWLVATPIMGLCALALYGWSQNPDAWMVGVSALIMLSWTLKATEAMTRHRAWHRAWDAMAEPMAKRPARSRPVLAALLVVGVATYLAANLDRPGYGIALGWMVLVASAIALWLLITCLRSWKVPRPATERCRAVTVAIKRPVLPVPDLTSAYNALPEHCRRAIDATRT